MGALPKRRISSQRGGKRQASQHLKLPSLTKCQHCGATKVLGHLCSNCKK